MTDKIFIADLLHFIQKNGLRAVFARPFDLINEIILIVDKPSKEALTDWLRQQENPLPVQMITDLVNGSIVLLKANEMILRRQQDWTLHPIDQMMIFMFGQVEQDKQLQQNIFLWMQDVARTHKDALTQSLADYVGLNVAINAVDKISFGNWKLSDMAYIQRQAHYFAFKNGMIFYCFAWLKQIFTKL
jgi:hypothetical protein